MKKALLSLLFFAALPAFATDSTLLQCEMKGSLSISGVGEREFSETVLIEATERDNFFKLRITGPTILGAFSGDSFTSEDGTKFTEEIVNGTSTWEFKSEVVRPTGLKRVESGRIDRRTGLFHYYRTSDRPNGITLYMTATGPCSKQSNARKF